MVARFLMVAIALVTVACSSPAAQPTAAPAPTSAPAPTAAPAAAKPAGAPDKVKLQIKWVPQAQFAGYFVALEKGFYKDENLDVTLVPGTYTGTITHSVS